MLNKPLPQQIYRHFKGNLYQIKTLATHTETGEELVIYQALYGDFKIYARPLSMFMEKVDRNKYPDVKQEDRFELCTESSAPESNPQLSEEQPLMQPESGEMLQTEPQQMEEEQLDIDPLVLEFLDANSYEERLNILAALHHRITDEMINTMAISVDLEIDERDTEERYEELKNCLLTLEKFECNRLR